MQFKTKRILTLLLPVQIALVTLLSFFPEVVEQYYSNGVYIYISMFLRYILGWIPFSMGDLGYGIVILLFLRFVYKSFFRKKINWKHIGFSIGATLSIFYGIFHLLWGINYYRMPLHEILDVEDTYTETELAKVTEQLIYAANTIHSELESNDTLAVHIPYTQEQLFEKTVIAYKEISSVFPQFEYTPKSIKPSLLSLPLTYMGFSGYLNPFTNEGQVNGFILKHKMPTTSCHEEAHQLGFAKENEANFIAALTTIHASDPYFRYSGITFALKFCVNDLYQRNEQKALCLIEEQLCPGVLKNYKEVNDFWTAYENPLEPIFKSLYDGYLKANDQPDGIDTYSYVSALLVNYYKIHPL